VSADDSLTRAEELLGRLETTRAELERLSKADDAERALDILGELAELSKAIEAELQRAKREAEAEAESDAEP
jgi:hypothetical protein